MKKYKWITIKEVRGQPGVGYVGWPIYDIINNKSQDYLGGIFFYEEWKQYVVQLEEGGVFNNSCLRDILDFMDNEIPKEGEDAFED